MSLQAIQSVPKVRASSKNHQQGSTSVPAPLLLAVPERNELASDSSRQAISLAVSSNNFQTDIELSRGSIPILLGKWHGELKIDGKTLSSDDRWTIICTETNLQCCYVELQRDLQDGYQLERQVFLARQDHFVFLADVIKGPSVQRGEYALRLPMAPPVNWKPAIETHDGTLMIGPRSVATVLPLSMPEWRTDASGRFVGAAQELELTIPYHGQRAQAALFIDLEPRRFRRPVTWRHLTVAEDLTAVSRDVAAGYRVQVGKSQWLIYRSLGPRANRSVLGQNFSTEFIVARFRPNGTAEKLLEIE